MDYTVICHDANWDIVKPANSDYLEAIATEPGCKDSSFGRIDHLVSVIYRTGSPRWSDFTAEGLEMLTAYLTLHGYKLTDVFRKPVKA